ENGSGRPPSGYEPPKLIANLGDPPPWSDVRLLRFTPLNPSGILSKLTVGLARNLQLFSSYFPERRSFPPAAECICLWPVQSQYREERSLWRRKPVCLSSLSRRQVLDVDGKPAICIALQVR